MVIDRLPMRADQVDVLRVTARGLENGRERGPREDVSPTRTFSSAIAADIKPLDVKDLAPHLGVVWMLAVVQQLDLGSGSIRSRHARSR